jgi:hypothetical protein
MKIGLIASAYNCSEFLQDCLDPWLAFKQDGEHELSCSFIHNCFYENKELGLPLNSSDDTEKILESYYDKGLIDHYCSSQKYLKEHEARNICLKSVLSDNVDYVWTLGLDEIFTIEEINNILNFIKLNSFVDWFKINYKNYVFDGTVWVDGFCPPRIFKVNCHGGLKELYYDDDFVYADGTDYKKLSSLEIPTGVAHVKHMTWLHSNGKAKVEYQKARWGESGCSYAWNYDENKLEFNKIFYKNKPLPVLHNE